MKYLLIAVAILALALPCLGGSRTDRAMLFTVGSLTELSVGDFHGGIGAKYYTSENYFLRGNVSYVSDESSSSLNGGVGLFKQFYQTSNTSFSLGAELGSTGIAHDYSFAVVANICYSPCDNIGLSLDNAVTFRKADKSWMTSSGGKFGLEVFF